VPFLRLTRDRRGFENTFLLHADHPGAKARLLYWYRTAPGIGLGRPALDEDAIRTIEENHPDIEFDWPAILALSEVMTPEEETPAPRPQPQQRREKKRRSASAPQDREALGHEDRDAEPDVAVEPLEPKPVEPPEPLEPAESASAREIAGGLRRALVDDLAGREVARALRARYLEIKSKIDRMEGERGAWLARAEAINPDAWQTPEAVLHGVSNAGAAYEKLKKEIAPPEPGPGYA
jgi:hypothetical protein